MRLGFLFVVLLLVCGTATACNTGLYGAAAGGSPPAPPATTTTTAPAHQFGGPENLLPNGSFTEGTDPWVQSGAAGGMLVTNSPHRVGSTALLVRPRSAESFGTKAVIATSPAKGARYVFDAWVHGSRDLAGVPVDVGLGVVLQNGKLMTAGVNARPLGRHWRHFAVRAKVPVAGAVNVTAFIVVPNSVSKHSWLAIDGVYAKLLPSGAR